MARSIQTSPLASLAFLVHSLEPTLYLLQTGAGAGTHGGEGPRPDWLCFRLTITDLPGEPSVVEGPNLTPLVPEKQLHIFYLFIYLDVDQFPWVAQLVKNRPAMLKT